MDLYLGKRIVSLSFFNLSGPLATLDHATMVRDNNSHVLWHTFISLINIEIYILTPTPTCQQLNYSHQSWSINSCSFLSRLYIHATKFVFHRWLCNNSSENLGVYPTNGGHPRTPSCCPNHSTSTMFVRAHATIQETTLDTQQQHFN